MFERVLFGTDFLNILKVGCGNELQDKEVSV